MEFPVNNAAQTYKLARAALQTQTGEASTPTGSQPTADETSFTVVQKLADTVAKGEQAAISQITTGADPHSMIEAISAAELAVETAVTVRNKVVEAYQELIRMPI